MDDRIKSTLFPQWPAHRVIDEDQGALVVDRPAGLAVQAPERGDDVHSRLSATRTQKLAVVHRPERELSGLTVFSIDKKWNGPLSTTFEKRLENRTLYAVIEGEFEQVPGLVVTTLATYNGATLLRIEEGDDGHLQKWTLDRIRSALGATVIGPMHLGHLELPESANANDPERRRYSAALPWTMRDVQIGDNALDREEMERRMRDAAWRREPILRAGTVSAVRLANEGGDGLEGIAVDLYDDWAVLHVYDGREGAQLEETLDAVYALGVRGVYVKYRRKQSNELVDTRREDVAPLKAVRGEDAPDGLVVIEEALRFRVRLGDGLSTGIFLDQRENRRWVRDFSANKRVLNLFSYTGPFTVAAAVGGASATVSVDVARPCLDVLRENLVENGLSTESNVSVCADVFGWLEGSAARGELFDLVICDPPSYSSTRDGGHWSSESDYKKLIAKAMPVVAAGGTLLVCSNHRKMSQDKLRRHVADGAKAAERTIKRIDALPDPVDFPSAFNSFVHLKALAVNVR